MALPKGLQSAAGGDDVLYGLKRLNADLRAGKKKAVMAMLAALQAQTVEELSTPGRGRVRWHQVKVRRPGRQNRAVSAKMIARAGRASAPGDPPAPDTGKLRGSIQIEYDDSTQKGRMGTNDIRAAPLNFGTRRAGPRRNTVILPRPFMEPALKKSKGAMSTAGIDAFRLVVRKRSGN